jgi:hypothetical protein
VEIEKDKKTEEVNERRWVAIALGVIAAAYVALVGSHLSIAYIDFGDGNYLYISRRVADGLVLYRDILSPQPPLHIYLGAMLVWIGSALGSALYTVRLFSIVLHLGTMLVMYVVGRRVIGDRAGGVASAAIYLVLPIGFWWSLGYESELLEIFFLMLSFVCFVEAGRGYEEERPEGAGKKMIAAGVLATCAMFTNMTAVPYVGFSALWLLVRRRRLVLWYLVPIVVVSITGVIVLELMSGGNYLANVFFNQVGTFPKREISGQSVVAYAVGKIVREGKDLLFWEGPYIMLGLLGLISFVRRSRQPMREYIGWYGVFSLLSIVFVSKGATMEYIFTLGEPFVALFAAYFVVEFVRWIKGRSEGSSNEVVEQKTDVARDTSRVLSFIGAALLILVCTVIGTAFIRITLLQKNYEQDANGVRQIVSYIEKYSGPGDSILAPPYYAFISKRRLYEEYSELFIWTIKYYNETIVEGRPGEGVRKAESIAGALARQEIPIVVLDLKQTGRIPPIRNAIERFYTPLLEKPLHTLNTPLQIYIPH